MTRIVYVNGAYKRYGEAAIHVEDRGFQFADAVIEVWRATRRCNSALSPARTIAANSRYRRRCGTRLASHHWRGHSAKSRSATSAHMQVTRGAGPRDFALPGPGVNACRRSSFSPAPNRAAVRTDWLKLGYGGQNSAGQPLGAVQHKERVTLLPAVLARDAARRARGVVCRFPHYHRGRLEQCPDCDSQRRACDAPACR